MVSIALIEPRESQVPISNARMAHEWDELAFLIMNKWNAQITWISRLHRMCNDRPLPMSRRNEWTIASFLKSNCLRAEVCFLSILCTLIHYKLRMDKSNKKKKKSMHMQDSWWNKLRYHVWREIKNTKIHSHYVR